MPRKGSTVRKSKSPMMSWHFRQLPFWERAEKLAERVGNCLIFNGPKDECGYGRMLDAKGKRVRLHRAVWERAHGPIPAGKVIMHTCDNRACFELSHLMVGTQTENIRDMHAKGRQRHMPYVFDVVY